MPKSQDGFIIRERLTIKSEHDDKLDFYSDLTIQGELCENYIEISLSMANGSMETEPLVMKIEDGQIQLPPIPIGDPVSDFSICLAIKGFGSIAPIVKTCYQRSNTELKKTFECLKHQLGSISKELAYAVAKCVFRQFGGDLLDLV